jgi:hypothetical protein
MEYIWEVTYVAYAIDDKGVDLKTIHWTCSKQDLTFSGSRYGTVSETDHYDDVVTIESQPESTWVALAKESMGIVEVAKIEASIDAQIEEQKNPTSGGFKPKQEKGA